MITRRPRNRGCAARHRLGSGVDLINPEDALEGEQVGMMTSYRHQGASVKTATVRKTISLPPDLARDAEETARAEGKTLLARVVVFLSNLGEIVEPAESLTVLADEPDNRIVECALAANAQLIVTGDRAMLALGEYRGIRIVSLSAYLG